MWNKSEGAYSRPAMGLHSYSKSWIFQSFYFTILWYGFQLQGHFNIEMTFGALDTIYLILAERKGSMKKANASVSI